MKNYFAPPFKEVFTGSFSLDFISPPPFGEVFVLSSPPFVSVLLGGSDVTLIVEVVFFMSDVVVFTVEFHLEFPFNIEGNV